ncbi:hypothetical protein K491DRAFT_757524 [Lophiostoma macrostomum CBS 122681]|uniref:F-box domain-containing protein n=1 Tax=Lophiostoma macrostomum CBS 122681 TaxID=1314788 RepID=A0A6A6T911_9PLEO|nr:hypothetical protein K491DRAFT_757524 [Lophiostoma macrostomum CBS 122681]
MAHIDLLPNELLLEIGDRIRGPHRNSDLASLSLVSRRLRPIGQENLLCEPAFNLTHLHTFLRELGHHYYLIPKIKCLEILSSAKGRVPHQELLNVDLGAALEVEEYPALPCPWELFALSNFRARCVDVINYFLKEGDYRRNWHTALNADIVQALLGVLLVILPNLKSLHIGASWLMDWPIFSSLTPPGVKIVEPEGWDHKWLSPVLQKLQAELQALEFPADMAAFVAEYRTVALFDFRGFKKLKHLSLSSATFCSQTRQPPPNPARLLPTSLELLRMSECTPATINFMNEICLAKKHGKFPSLKRVELYFWSSVRIICSAARRRRDPHPVHDVRRMCADAEIELYLYFPMLKLSTRDLGRAPWSIREEGISKLKAVELAACSRNPLLDPRWLAPEPFELTSDLEGDIVMME